VSCLDCFDTVGWVTGMASGVNNQPQLSAARPCAACNNWKIMPSKQTRPKCG